MLLSDVSLLFRLEMWPVRYSPAAAAAAHRAGGRAATATQRGGAEAGMAPERAWSASRR